VLYCTLLYCIVLYYTVLNCTYLLYCIVLYFIVLYCILLYCTELDKGSVCHQFCSTCTVNALPRKLWMGLETSTSESKLFKL